MVKATLVSHRQPCSSVAWSPTDSHLLISGSYDEAVGAYTCGAVIFFVYVARFPGHSRLIFATRLGVLQAMHQTI